MKEAKTLDFPLLSLVKKTKFLEYGKATLVVGITSGHDCRNLSLCCPRVSYFTRSGIRLHANRSFIPIKIR